MLRLPLRVALARALVAVLVSAPVLWSARAMAAASPYWAICSAVALRSFGLLAALCLPVLIAAVFVRRIFCRFACPVGLLADGCGKLRPGPKPRIGKVPRLGQWVALASLGAAVLGCPLFVWLDPLAIFGAVAGAAQEPVPDAGIIFAAVFVQEYALIVTIIPAALLAAILLLSFIVPNLWCGRLCPLGGTQDMLRDLGRAVWLRKPDAPPRSKTLLPLARRTVLCTGAGAAWMLVIPKLFGRTKTPLRPPGARDETTFKAMCIRCGNCIRACPAKIIKRDMSGQATSALSPVIRFPRELHTKGYCSQTCHACTQSCPTGAIERLTLKEKNLRPIGLAVVRHKDCRIWQGENCGYCTDWCPQMAIEIDHCQEEYASSIVIDSRLCNGCGLCLTECPEWVISIERACPPRRRLPAGQI